ncbi:MAG: sigma 54-interacting transcriptional regulator [Thermodesulfobacteriota bacterium]
MSKKDKVELNEEELSEKYRRILIESESLATRLSIINEVANTITSLTNIDEIFKVIVNNLKWVFDYHSCSICLLSDDRTYYTIQAHYDPKRISSLKDKRFQAGYGVAGCVMKKGEPFITSNIKEEEISDPSADNDVFGQNIKSALSLPIRVDGNVIGSLNLGSDRENSYSIEELKSTNLIGLQIGIALKNRQLLEQLTAANNELEYIKKNLEVTVEKRTAELLESKERYQVILEINNSVISNLKLNDLLIAIAKTIKAKLPYDATSITLYESVQDVLKVYAFEALFSSGYIAPGLEVPREGSHVGWVMDNKKPLVAYDLTRELRFPQDKMFLDDGLRSYIVTPLIIKGQAVGTFNVASKIPNRFQTTEVEYLSLIAKQIALAIDNVNCYEELETFSSKIQKEKIYLQEEIQSEYNFEEIIGGSKALKKILRQIEMVAKSDTTVLIMGETGTGKELIARAIHNISTRKDRALIKVNCPAIPTGLIESELFGHEQGAFTGALRKKIGKFELADGGTIFLDEIGDLPIETQSKLLRVLQEMEFEQVGGTKIHKVDVRVIAATNRDLEEAVKDGKFRADLYYRLNVFPITLPPLRERKEDIPVLASYFAQKFIKKLGKEIKSVSETTMERLKGYSWPGNIRELENIVERAVILSTGDTLEINESLLSSLSESDAVTKDDGPLGLEDLEREHIIKVLNQTRWQIHGEKGAAKILGINPSTLRTRMVKLGIKKNKQP